MRRIRLLLPALALVLFGLAPRPAAADPIIAMNDDVDFAELLSGSKTVGFCPCFCTFEGFGATFTAPEEMSIQYIYMLYSAMVPVETAVDFHIFQGAGTDDYFLTGPESVPTIGQYLPLQMGSTELMEISVVGSGVQPPTVAAGEQFTVGIVYNYGADDGFGEFEPETSGHGPTYDGGVSSGVNWVYSFDSENCDGWNGARTWLQLDYLPGDWVIRVSDEQVDWEDQGDDDDDAGSDDDDAGSDDDDAGSDDDDDDGLVVLGITPTSMQEGESIDIAVTGAGFDDTAQLFIGAFRASNTTFVSDQRLDAGSPQGIPASDTPYEVVVSLSDGSTSTLPGAFTVEAKGPGCQSSLVSGGAGLIGLLLFGVVAICRKQGR